MTRALCVVLVVASIACAPEEIVVETIASDAGAEAAAGGCMSNDDCLATELCARADCKVATGNCQLRPVLCDDVGPPVCGCDGVTYWNDCLRLRSGVTASTMGECRTNAATCNDPSASQCPLPSGVASCSRLLPPGTFCSAGVPGVCWVLPSTCPMMMGDRWESCRFPRMCDGTCDAIRSGEPHRLAPPGPTCM